MNESKKILGICPECYLTVQRGEAHVHIAQGNDQVYFHFDCSPRRKQYLAVMKQTWLNEGEYVREQRKRGGFTQAEAAEYLGVSASKISKLERGEPVTHARLLTAALALFYEKQERLFQEAIVKSRGMES